MNRKRFFWLWTALLVLMLAVTGCGGADQAGSTNTNGDGNQTETSSDSSSEPGKTELIVGMDDDPPQMDPHFSTAAVDRQTYQSLYDKLIDIDANLNLVPQLAEDWEISEDGKVYTFFLRQGVTFHDGTPFNAEAVKFNFERMMDPDAGSPRASELSPVQEVRVVDEYTVEVELDAPFSPFLAVLTDRAGMMVSPTAVQEKGKDFSNSPVGTGPFQFVERVVQDRIVLERYDDYWGELPKVTKITIIPYADENVRVTNLLSGDADIINRVPPKEIEKLKQSEGIELAETGTLGFQGLYLNHKGEPFNNAKLRKALDLVIDREAIKKVVMRDAVITAAGPIPPSSWAYDDSLEVVQRDVEKAKQLMAEAGYPDGFSFTLMINPKPVEQQMGEMIQSMAAEAGIDVKLEIVEFGTMLDKMDNHEFHASRLGWSGRTDPDGNVYPLLHSTGYINYGYSNPEVDGLLEQARQETAPDKRRALYTEATKIAQDEAAYIFLYHEIDYKAYKDNLKGFTPYPDTMMRFHHVYFE